MNYLRIVIHIFREFPSIICYILCQNSVDNSKKKENEIVMLVSWVMNA